MPEREQYSLIGVRLRAFLDRRIPLIWCFIGWIGASAVYYVLVGVLGGPVEGDSAETVYSTWSFAHGDLACAYPHLGKYQLNNLARPYSLASPLYSLISGAAAAILRIGHDVAFPTRSEFGPNCKYAIVDMFNWSAKSSAILPTIRLSYLVWPILMGGIIALVRAAGRGGRMWEPFTLLIVACTPTVLMCITYYFHPEDLLAMALILAAMAAVISKRWSLAGVLIGLGYCAQPFAILVAAAILVVAPGRQRLQYVLGAVVAVLVVDVPLVIATSGRAFKNIALGSSRAGIINRSVGGTVLWEADLHGVPLFLCSRVAPILVVMAIAWWAHRRLGSRLLRPIPLVSLMATAVIMRLVFEVNLFGYYFMAASVSLLVLEVVRGHFRGTVLAWIGIVTIAFNPINAGFFSNLTGHTLDLYRAVPILVMALMVASVVVDAAYHRFRAYKIVWIVVASVAGQSMIGTFREPIFRAPHWLWQVVLVPIALGLAIKPLLGEMKVADPLEEKIAAQSM